VRNRVAPKAYSTGSALGRLRPYPVEAGHNRACVLRFRREIEQPGMRHDKIETEVDSMPPHNNSVG